MAATEYQIHVHHRRTGALLTVLSLFNKASFQRVRNDAGNFSITVPWLTDDDVLIWQLDNFVDIYRDVMQDDGTIDHTWVYGGTIKKRTFGVSDEGEQIIVEGIAYLSLLSGRIIFPFVDRTVFDQQTQSYLRYTYHTVPYDPNAQFRALDDPNALHPDFKGTPAVAAGPPLLEWPSGVPVSSEPLPSIPFPPAPDPYYLVRDPADPLRIASVYKPTLETPAIPPKRALPPRVPPITEPLADVPTAPADDVIKEYVRKHVAIGAVNWDWTNSEVAPNNTRRGRRLLATVEADTHQSSLQWSWKGRFNHVLEVAQAIALSTTNAAGHPLETTLVEFDIVREEDPLDPAPPGLRATRLIFKTWVPRPGVDRSAGQPAAVIFDPYSAQITNVEVIEDISDLRNWIVSPRGTVKGPEADAAAYFYLDSRSISVYDREEDYVDTSSAKDDDQRAATVGAFLNDHLPVTSAVFDIAASGQWELGRDFDYGDRVTILWRDIELSDTITGVEVELEGGSFAKAKIAMGAKSFHNTYAMIRLGRLLRSMQRNVGEIRAVGTGQIV